MDCKHENQHLMGTADGIVCRKCGRVFRDFSEINPAEAPAPVVEKPAEAQKKARSKKK